MEETTTSSIVIVMCIKTLRRNTQNPCNTYTCCYA